MVSGGICNEGLWEVIFHSGYLKSLAWKKVLKFYDYIQQKNGEWELGKEIDKNYLQKKVK